MNKIFICITIFWNIIVFSIYALDKYLAKKDKRRIPEKNLILIAILIGSLGALLSMLFFKHKIKKNKFKILIPMFLITHIFIIIKFLIN